MFRRRWRIWAGLLLAGLLGAIAVNTLAPPRYTATTTSFVTVEDTANDGSSEIFQGSQFAVQRVKSYISLGTSPGVLEPVIEELGLNLTLREFRKQIEVSSPPDSALMRVSVEDADGQQASLIANEVTEQLGRQIEVLETPRGRVASRVKVTVIQPAETPIEPSFPPVLLNLVLGVVGGAVVGMVAAVARHHFDHRMTTVGELRRVTGAAPLGVVSQSRPKRRDPLVARREASPGAQQYRNLRSVLNLIYPSKARRHFVVSAASSGDGATTVATNLAISWAKAGATVCLVDTNLHRPRVMGMLGLEGGRGLTDVLTGRVELDGALRSWHNDLVTVLPTGAARVDSAQALGSQAMGRLVDQLRSRFDVVIYDAPAMTSAMDAALLSRHVNGLVLVARANATTTDSLASTFELARRVGLKVLGTVGIGFSDSGGAIQQQTASQAKPELIKSRSLVRSTNGTGPALVG